MRKTDQNNFKFLKYTNWTLTMILVMLVFLSLQLGFLSKQVSYIQKTVIMHDKIVYEALSCVEDPDCTIDPEFRDIYLDIKEAE